MRKKYFTLPALLFFCLSGGVYAEGTLYTFVLNIVTEDFKLPLVGAANFARGDHSIFQLGALNINTGNFSGLQAAAANITGGDTLGAQLGALNINTGNFLGLQAAAANITGSDTSGAQLGALNINAGNFFGLQAAAVNISGGDTSGVQLGALNFAGKMNGLQIGVVNIVLDGANTIPIGLIPIVLENGYYAVEVCVSDIAPGAVSLKMGIPKFYTTLMANYHLDAENFCIGGGFGTLFDINESLFFNMELNSLNIVNKNTFYLFSAEPAAGYALGSNISLLAGVSFRWQYTAASAGYKNLLRLRVVEIDAENSILIGFKAALRYTF